SRASLRTPTGEIPEKSPTLLLIDEVAVDEPQLAVGHAGDVRIVGDDQERLPRLLRELEDELLDLLGRGGVEVSRGLVAEDDVRVADQRPGDRDALALAARQLGRQ